MIVLDNYFFIAIKTKESAFEARTIHYNRKKKSKGIYGNASKQDIKELKEEGIDTQTIPWIRDTDN